MGPGSKFQLLKWPYVWHALMLPFSKTVYLKVKILPKQPIRYCAPLVKLRDAPLELAWERSDGIFFNFLYEQTNFSKCSKNVLSVSLSLYSNKLECL
jgi:hypothetical protein